MTGFRADAAEICRKGRSRRIGARGHSLLCFPPGIAALPALAALLCPLPSSRCLSFARERERESSMTYKPCYTSPSPSCLGFRSPVPRRSPTVPCASADGPAASVALATCIVLLFDCIVAYCIALHCIALCFIASYCIVLIELHCIAFYCIALYCIVSPRPPRGRGGGAAAGDRAGREERQAQGSIHMQLITISCTCNVQAIHYTITLLYRTPGSCAYVCVCVFQVNC